MNAIIDVTNTDVHVLLLSPVCHWVFFNTISHLAHPKCGKLYLLVKMWFLHFYCLSVLIFPPASSISPLPCCSGLSLHISSCHSLSHLSHFSAPHLSLRPLPLFLSFSGWLIHFIVHSLQVYPRKSAPAVDRLCVGVPAAEVSQMLLNHTSSFSRHVKTFFHIYTFDYFWNSPATSIWKKSFNSLLRLKIQFGHELTKYWI